MSSMIAVIPVRAGLLPAGGAEAAAEARGRVLLVGEGTDTAAAALAGIATEIRAWETAGFAPADWAARLAPVLAAEHVVLLPGAPDGRDLAPRLAAHLERPLHAAVMELGTDSLSTIGFGGRLLVEHQLSGPVVAWLQPGVRGVEPGEQALPSVEALEPAIGASTVDATIDEVLAPDVATMDLSEAPRLLGGGAGLDSAARFAQLGDVAAALDAAMGATRVITDRSWVGHSRQIGTTGVVVDPALYLAFGISGAVQHTAGLGDPDHIISVNTDPHCPMMELADLAVVSDANATLDELARLLGVDGDGQAATTEAAHG